MERFLITFTLSRFGRAWRALSLGQGITIGLFLLVVAGFGSAVYYGLQRGLSTVAADPFLGVALPGYLYQLFLLVTLGLIVVSVCITGLYTFYRNQTDVWLMVSPKFRWFIWLKAARVLVLSLWPVIILTIPLLAAMQQVFAVPWYGVVLGFGLVLTVALTAGLSALCVLLLVSWGVMVWFPNTQRRIGAVLVLLGGMVAAMIAYVWWPLQSVALVELFQARNLALTEAPVATVMAAFAHVPSHGAAQALLALQQGELAVVWQYTMLYALAGLFALIIYSRFATLMLPLWQHFSSGMLRADTESLIPSAQRTYRSWQFGRYGLTQALLYKEVMVLMRDGRELAWLGFLVLLWTVIASFDVLLMQLVTRLAAPVVPADVVLAVQLLITAYFVAAIVLRFVFPAFSVERPLVWRIFVAPVERTRWFVVKGGWYAAVIALITVVIIGVHSILVPSTPLVAAWFALFALVQGLTLAFVGYGIGVWFPSAHTTDPAQISTSVPGLFFTFGAIGYGTTSAWVFYQWVTVGASFLTWWFLFGSVAVSGLVLWGAQRAFGGQEFTLSQQR